MARVVVDASAIIAVVNNEPGAEVAKSLSDSAFMSASNYAEVVNKLARDGFSEHETREILGGFRLNVVPFDSTQAFRAGRLRAVTRGQNISMADHACLGLAWLLNVPAVTADRKWMQLSLGVDIRLFR